MAGSLSNAGRSQSNPILLTDTKVAGYKAGQEAYDVRDAKVQGLRLRVGTTGKKTWSLKARVPNGSVMNRKLGNYPAMGLAAARTAAIAALEAVSREGSAGVLDRTFGNLADAWVEKIKTRNRSWHSQSRRLELHVLPHWRERRLVDLKRRDVRDLIAGVEGDVLPNRVLTVIKTVFRFGLSNDWIEVNAADGVDKPSVDKARDRVLDMGEVARIWKAAEHLGFPFTQYVRVLLLTAQRRTEVASMRRGSVDLDEGTWNLTANETKAGRAHHVPLTPIVAGTIKSAPRFGEAFVFTTDGETHISGFAKMKNRLDHYLAGDGEGAMEQWTFHDLRRTAATHMVRLGVLEDVVGKVLNHAPQGVTAKVYALHRYAAEKRDALERWAIEVMKAVEGEKVVILRSA